VLGGISGFTAEQIDQLVGNAFKFQQGKPLGGEAGTLYDSFSKMAGQYMVPQSQQAIGKWVQNSIHDYTQQFGFQPGAESKYETYLKEQAAKLYPEMAGSIQAGITPYDFTDPYRQLAAKTLEIAPDSVDLTNPKWSFALHQMSDKGTPQMMTLSDFQRQIMANPTFGYQHTLGARDQAYQGAAQLLSIFGKAGF
jgi:hypothetical protein